MASSRSLAIVAGAGPGLGQALISRFEAAGMETAGLGRTAPDNPVGRFHQVDLADAQQTSAAIAGLISQHGAPKLVVHNTAELVIAPFQNTRFEDFQRSWASMMKTEDIAEAYWQLYLQPSSTWTHELDLRPPSEVF